MYKISKPAKRDARASRLWHSQIECDARSKLMFY